jgi:hypothetical protein
MEFRAEFEFNYTGDEMQMESFNMMIPMMAEEQKGEAAVAEPSALLLLGLGALTIKKRRK